MRSEPFGCTRDVVKSADNVGIKIEKHKGGMIFVYGGFLFLWCFYIYMSTWITTRCTIHRWIIRQGPSSTYVKAPLWIPMVTQSFFFHLKSWICHKLFYVHICHAHHSLLLDCSWREEKCKRFPTQLLVLFGPRTNLLTRT